MICNNCKNEIRDGAKFCPSCGAKQTSGNFLKNLQIRPETLFAITPGKIVLIIEIVIIVGLFIFFDNYDFSKNYNNGTEFNNGTVYIGSTDNNYPTYTIDEANTKAKLAYTALKSYFKKNPVTKSNFDVEYEVTNTLFGGVFDGIIDDGYVDIIFETTSDFTVQWKNQGFIGQYPNPIGEDYKYSVEWGKIFEGYSYYFDDIFKYDVEYDGHNELITITKYIGKSCYVDIPPYFKGRVVVAIDERAFEGTNVETVIIGDSIETIGDNAFHNCKLLKTIEFRGDVKEIGNYAFEGCNGITEIEIPDSVETIGYRAFGFCTGLKEIKIPDSVETIEDFAFDCCTSLKKVKIPDSVKVIGEGAFMSCENLEDVSIPDSVETIGGYAFYRCTSLKNCKIPDSVEIIYGSAFDRCYRLEEIVIPDSVEQIGSGAFRSCTNLKYVEISGSVEVINNYIFDGCVSLREVECDGMGLFTFLKVFQGSLIYKKYLTLFIAFVVLIVTIVIIIIKKKEINFNIRLRKKQD